MENNQHKDFDNFFQKKLNNRQFDYQDDFWTEMESQLPQAKTATKEPKGESRKRFLFLLFFLVGFLTLIGWFSYPSDNHTFVTKGKVVSESESIIEIPSNTDLDSDFNSDSNPDLEVNSEAVVNVRKKIFFTDVENNNIFTEKNVGNTFINVNTRDKNPEIIKSSLTIKPSLKDIEIDVKINTEENENTIINTTKNPLSTPQPIAKLQETNGQNTQNENTASNIFSHNNNEVSLISVPTKQFDLIKEQVDKSNLIQPLCDGCPILPPSHEFKVSLIAGLNTSLGFQNVANKRANPSFDPSIGFRLTYRHSMTSPWRTSVEAIYFSRSALNSQIGYDSISYGFGSTIVSRSINIEELHYISLPIYATYQYKRKHTFLGGLSFGYLLNAQSQTAGNVFQMTAQDANIYAEPVTQEWGYTTAFNRFDIGASLGYDYEVQTGWKIGTRLNYGLMDITKNSVFNNNIFDNNISLRLIMTCDLFIL